MSRLKSFSNISRRRGQGLVEFALILPLLLLLIMGIMDFGRALFTYGQASSQLREALRQGAAIGLPDGTIPPYRDCPNMRALAKKVFFSQPIDDSKITIQYARVASGTSATRAVFDPTSREFTGTFTNCVYNLDGTGSGLYGPKDLANGDVLQITEEVTINMITPFLPVRQLTFTLKGQRTVITSIAIASDYCGNLICDPGEGDPSDPSLFCMADCAQPDLHMTVSGPSTGVVAQNLVYQFTVKNDRPSPYNTPAPNVKVTYQIPANVMYVGCGAPLGATCSMSGSQVTWDLGTVYWSTTVFKQITLTVLPLITYSSSTPLQVSALVSTSGADPHNDTTTCTVGGVGDNVACMKTTVVDPTGDIRVSASSDVPSGGIEFDQNITLTLTGYKNGGGTPTGVHLTLNGLPTGFIFVSADPNCSYNAAAGTADCNLGAPSSYPVIKKIILQAHQEGTFTSTGAITWNSGSFTDTNASNNTSTFSYKVNQPKAYLSIRKQLTSSGTTFIGATVNYSLIIFNSGPNQAAAPTVVDTFPDDPSNPWAAVAYQSYNVSPAGSVTGFALSGSNNTVATWTLGNLAAGATVTINVVAKARSDGTWTNSAMVSSPTFDDIAGDNQDSVIVTTDVLPQVTNVKPWKLRCTGRASRRYMGLSWTRVTGATGYYIYANGVLIGQTTDGTGKITQCGGSIGRSRPKRVSGCYNLSPASWQAGTSVIYTIAAFLSDPVLRTGPQSQPVTIKC